MTLINFRDRSQFERSLITLSTAEQRAFDLAERFKLFVEGRRQSETHATFYLNHSNSTNFDYNTCHDVFAEELAIAGIIMPNYSIDFLVAQRNLDGESLELYKDSNVGKFVARQIIFLDTIPCPPERVLPPGSLYVDYFAGYLKTS